MLGPGKKGWLTPAMVHTVASRSVNRAYLMNRLRGMTVVIFSLNSFSVHQGRTEISLRSHTQIQKYVNLRKLIFFNHNTYIVVK